MIIGFLGYVPFSPGESFPERLKSYRKLKGLTQRQLARELGVDPTTVMKWEVGTSQPAPGTREQVLGVIDGVADRRQRLTARSLDVGTSELPKQE